MVRLEAGTWLGLITLLRGWRIVGFFIGIVVTFILNVLFIMPEAIMVKAAERSILKMLKELSE